MPFETLLTRREGEVEYLTLNRPDVRNAFNEQMIADLTAWAAAINADDDVRVVVMAGAGKVFSAGAEIGGSANSLPFMQAEDVRGPNAPPPRIAPLPTGPQPPFRRH